MKRFVKRFSILMLCVALVMGDNAFSTYASEMQYDFENTTVIDASNEEEECEELISDEECFADQFVVDENDESGMNNIEESFITNDFGVHEIVEDGCATDTNGEDVSEDGMDYLYVADSYEKGTGTENDPYTIINLAQFRYFETEAVSSYEKKYYRLESDIYINEDLDKSQNGFSVGYGNGQARNYFDGGGHTIYNLYVSDEIGGYSLLGSSFWEIKNLNICNVKIETSNMNYSIFANQFYVISNCKIQGEVNITIKDDNPSSVGGYSLNAIASGCFTHNGVGGRMENCVNEASINISVDVNRYKKITVKGIGDAIYINNCANKGTMHISEKAYEGVQGFGGDIYGIGHATEEMTNCKTTESCSITIDSSDPHATIYGIGYGKLIEDSSNYAQLEGGYAIYGIGEAVSIYRSNNYGVISDYKKASGVAKSISGYIQDCHNYGHIEGGESYYTTTGVVDELKSGSSMKECSNEEDLYGDGVVIGLCNKVNSGTTIKNCFNKGSITASNSSAAGLFYIVYPQVLIENCYNLGAISGGNAAGIACDVYNSTVIENCFNSGRVNANNSACGLFDIIGISWNNDEDYNTCIRGCYNIGSVNASCYAYGLCYAIDNGDIIRCFNGGKIIGEYKAVGLIGKIEGYNERFIKIEDCFNAGQLIANSDDPIVGGILGNISQSYSEDDKINLTIKNCYNIAPISAKFEKNWGKVGRLVGYINSYSENKWDEYSLSGLYTKCDDNIPAVGKYGYGPTVALAFNERSDYELQQQSTYVEYDFENVWFNDTKNADYPYPMLKGVGNVSLNADYESIGGSWFNITWKIKNGTLYIDGYGDMPKLDQNNNGPWYEYKDTIQSIVIGENITSINDYSFKGLDKVSDVTIKGIIQKIGYRAFDGCSNLKSISLPEGITEIGGYAFYKCSELVEIELPNSISSIGSHAFEKCTSLKSVTIPNELKKIKSNLFYGCSSLETISIPDTVSEIETDAFHDCSKLNDVTIPEGVTVIRSGLFRGCSSLKHLVIPSTIISIEDNAFSYCENLFTINFNGTRTQWEKVHISFYTEKVLKEKAVESADGFIFGYFKYLTYNEIENEYYNFTYSDSWFNDSSYKYNHDFCRMSLKAAMAAFGVNKLVKNDSDITSSAVNIKDLMQKLGFESDRIEINYRLSNSKDYYDNIGTAIGSKIIDDNGKKSTIIMVAIRGAGYQAEWGGNLNVGSNAYTDHNGFRIAALTVVSRLSDYIDDYQQCFEGDIKIWTMGYSRAAAVSNLFAAYLDNGVLDNIQGKNVFAYCFECPQNTVSWKAQNDKYGNIWSIVNPNDIVTKVAPSSDNWYFTRYGTTYTLPTYENTSDFSDFTNRNDKYIDILSYKGNNTMREYQSLIQQYYWQEDLFNDVVDLVSQVALSRDNYSLYLQPTMKDIGVSTMSSVDANPWTLGNITLLIIDTVGTCVYGFFNEDFRKGILKKVGVSAARVVVNKLTIGQGISYFGSNISNAHTPELCLAWMESISEKKLAKEKGYRKLFTNCPVDIEVRDAEGSLIGKIVNDEVVDTGNDNICVNYDTNGQKIAILPLDSEYSVEFVANDDGEMTYTVAEYISGERLPQKITCFQDVDISKGERLESEIEEAVDKDVEYNLIRDNGQVLDTTFVIVGDEIKKFAINVSSEGPGTADHSGTAIPGQYYAVTATPMRKDSDFIGWYEGDELVSTDLTYRFFVERDVNLTAKFDSIDGQLWIKNVDDGGYDYTGKAVKPNFEVYDGTTLLTKNVDYTVSFKNNVNTYAYGENDEGFNSKLAPSITITGKGNYTDKEIVYFKINKIDITGNVLADELIIKSTGKAQKPKPVITWNKKALPTTGYSYAYYAADEEGNPVGEKLTSVKDAGNYVIVVTGKGNFTGTKNISLRVVDTQKLASKLTIASIKSQSYTGEAIEPKVTVIDGKKTLTEGTHYSVEYTNNIAVGTATVIVTGLGDYVGTKKATFKITGTSLSKATVTGVSKSVKYTGADITFDNINVYFKATKTRAQINLTEGIDYKIEYLKNKKVGTGTVVIKGINGYTGSIKKNFSITAAKRSEMTDRFKVEFTDIAVETEGIAYSKGGAKPGVKVTFVNADGSEQILTKKTDYTVTYSNNTAVNDQSNPKKLPTVKVTLKGNYSGTISKNFSIVPKDISLVKAQAADKVYQNKKNIYATTLTLKDSDGKKLVAGKDYEKTLQYSYVETTEVVCGGVKVTRNAGEKVSSNDIIPAETKIKVTAYAKSSNYKESVSAIYRIAKSSIASAKVSIPKQTYTGKEVYIDGTDITVKIGRETLTYGDDFEIVPGTYANNIKKGDAIVVIRGIGNYGATKKVTFTIKKKLFQWWWRKTFSILNKKVTFVAEDNGTVKVRNTFVVEQGEVDKVQFLVWTTKGGKDDLRSEIVNDFTVSPEGNVVADYAFKTSAHNNETGEYNISVIAIGKNGDKLEAGALKTNITSEVIPEGPDEPGDNPSDTEDYSFDYNVSDGEVKIRSLKGEYEGDLIIPSEIDGMPVTGIGEMAFMTKGLKGKLVLPNTLKTIDAYAFEYCSFTGDLIIPDGVTTIGDYAFGWSGFDGQLVLPNGLTSIGKRAFAECGFTGTLTIPQSVTAIGSDTFLDIVSLDRIINNSSVIVYLPSDQVWVNDATGEKVSSITKGSVTKDMSKTSASIVFDANGGQIFNGISYDETKITYQIVGEKVKLITEPTKEGYTFDGWWTEKTGGTKLDGNSVVPDTDSIRYYAHWKGVSEGTDTSITLLYEVQDGYAVITGFSGTPTGDVIIPSSIGGYQVKKVANAFNGATKDVYGFTGRLVIEEGIEELESYAFCYLPVNGTLVLPNSLKTIGLTSIYGMKNLTDIYIPSTLENISNFNFKAEYAGFSSESEVMKCTFHCVYGSPAYEYITNIGGNIVLWDGTTID